MLGHPTRAHPRPPASMRDTKSLGQVEMANILSLVAWPAEADLRIHVGAFHVTLPAVRMNKLADFFDRFFKNPMSRWICHHQRSQLVAMDLGFSSQILEVDVALLIASDWNHFQAGHD